MANNFVIGGGWSLTPYIDSLNDLMSFGHVIGVNEASVRVNVHEAITMDRLWFEHRWSALKTLRVQKVWVREKCDCNVPRKDESDNWMTFKHFNKNTPSVTYGELHGGNSGTCGINLALQRMLDGDNLFLLGFDMCKGPHEEPYWHPPYSWTSPAGATKPGHFNEWVKDMAGFASYAKVNRLNVYNVSSRSKITYFPKIKYEAMMEMIS